MFGVFRVQGTCLLSGGWKCRSSPLGGNMVLALNSLARFEGSLHGWRKVEKKGARERKGREKTPSQINFWLRPL